MESIKQAAERRAYLAPTHNRESYLPARLINHQEESRTAASNQESHLKKKKEPEVVFNVAGTRYSVVKEVGKNIMRWTLSIDPNKEWDVAWIDWVTDASIFSKLKPFQKISFFPGIECLARKDQLGKNLLQLKRAFPNDYDFFPETFILPSDFEEFRMQALRSKNQTTFIVKPQASCQGRGIFLTQSLAEIDRTKSYVAQKYLNEPYLLDGLKFDMRIYVLLASCDPLKIFLYEDGLVRFATEPYSDPNVNNLSDVCMHLTNYAINKNNPNFIFNGSANRDDVGHKRSIKAVFKVLEERGHDIHQLWDEIKRIIIKTFCSGQHILAHNYKFTHPANPYVSSCFQVFGFDILLDNNLKPWLLEINQSPSWATDTPLDQSIKERVIADALRIMNVSAKDRQKYKKKARAEIEARSLNGRNSKKLEEQIRLDHEEAKQEVERWEAANLGGYEKIYPIENDFQNEQEIYKKFMTAAKEAWNGLTGLCKLHIEERK